jgi:hypothetical protein
MERELQRDDLSTVDLARSAEKSARESISDLRVERGAQTTLA